jgi:lysophospholipase L1-like esterase
MDCPDSVTVVRVAFYGDSIVTGWRGISAPELRWSSIVASELGWQELNVAMDGLGFVRWRGPDKTNAGEPLGVLGDVLASDADACIVALGCNDAVLVHEMRDEVETAIARDLDLLLDRFHSNNVIVMDLYSKFADEHPPGWRAVRGLLEGAVLARGLSLTPGLSQAIRLDLSLLCDDQVHPNDQGHAALAQAALPHLRRALGNCSCRCP